MSKAQKLGGFCPQDSESIVKNHTKQHPELSLQGWSNKKKQLLQGSAQICISWRDGIQQSVFNIYPGCDMSRGLMCCLLKVILDANLQPGTISTASGALQFFLHFCFRRFVEKLGWSEAFLLSHVCFLFATLNAAFFCCVNHLAFGLCVFWMFTEIPSSILLLLYASVWGKITVIYTSKFSKFSPWRISECCRSFTNGVAKAREKWGDVAMPPTIQTQLGFYIFSWSRYRTSILKIIIKSIYIYTHIYIHSYNTYIVYLSINMYTCMYISCTLIRWWLEGSEEWVRSISSVQTR